VKIALQTGLVPGGTVADKQRWAADHGVEGLEIGSGDCSPENADATLRAYENSPVPVVSICGNPSFDFLDPSKEKRRKSVDECKQCLAVAGKLGAVGQIVPPIFGPPRLPDLSPLEDPITLEKRLLVELCKELGDAAAAAGTLLLLEPLNRYEQHLLRRQATASRSSSGRARRRGADLGLFPHAHRGDRHPGRAARRRRPPRPARPPGRQHAPGAGTGDIDFVAGFRALRDIGFTGYMAFECGISGGTRRPARPRSPKASNTSAPALRRRRHKQRKASSKRTTNVMAAAAATKDKIRVGLIGCGGISGAHLPHLSASEDVELAAFCDVVVERAQKHADKYGGAVYDDARTMLQNTPLDAAYILIPTYAHGAPERACLERGFRFWSKSRSASTRPTCASWPRGRGVGFDHQRRLHEPVPHVDQPGQGPPGGRPGDPDGRGVDQRPAAAQGG
jgi:sugar phosphate isomerase/epimerase